MMQRTPDALKLEAVGKAYGRTTALSDVGFTLAAGEFVVLLGANGAGKSTLVQLVTGLFAPDEGRITVAGADLSADPIAALRRLGVVFQQQTLDPELTLRGNLRYHADLHGLPSAEAARRIGELAGRFGFADRLDDRTGTLSGGSRRRLELARALLHRPQVLIMDEASVGLDPPARAELLDHVVGLAHDDGVLVLWATHLLDEAARADRLLFLEGGRLLFDGPPDEALRRSGAATIEDAFFSLTGRKRLGEAAL